MPGLIGIVKKRKENIVEVENIQNILSYDQKCKKDDLYADESIICSRVHLNIIGDKESPKIIDNVFCWVYGECYNYIQIGTEYNLTVNSFSELLIYSYQSHQLSEIAQKINGYYSAVIYDKINGLVKLITDRFGFKHIYFWNDGNNIAWCSELKGFSYFNEFSKEINSEAVESFLDLGQFIGDITWFKNVSLIDASTILTINVKNKKIQKERYWNWDKIKKQNVELNEAMEKLTAIWRKIIHRNYKDGKKMGISLSGGLDSRSILAFSEPNRPDFVYTFGMKGCDDIKIAREVCSIKNLPHTIFDLNKKNWFDQKIQAVWKTDGQINLIHFHNSPSNDKMKDKFEINLDGFAGDLVMGGGFINNNNSRITIGVAKKKFGKSIKNIDINDNFYNFNCEDPFIIDNRIRRFTIFGIIYNSMNFESRIPFLDNKLIEYIYSLPDIYRSKYKISHQIYLKVFPNLFSKIKWQKTGYQIGKKKPIFRKILDFFKMFLIYYGSMKNSKYFSDYGNWTKFFLKSPIAKEIIENQNPLFLKYVKNKKRFKRLLGQKITNLFWVAKIFRYITLEIWLQQIFNKKYLEST